MKCLVGLFLLAVSVPAFAWGEHKGSHADEFNESVALTWGEYANKKNLTPKEELKYASASPSLDELKGFHFIINNPTDSSPDDELPGYVITKEGAVYVDGKMLLSCHTGFWLIENKISAENVICKSEATTYGGNW